MGLDQSGWGTLLVLMQNELLLFASVFFLLGALDEFAVDIAFLWLKLSGSARTMRVDESAFLGKDLRGPCAVFIPAWQEASVIGVTIAHAASAWPYRELRVFVGCYRNDEETQFAALASARRDSRISVVVHDVDGPTCKADCLNRLYHALDRHEATSEATFRMVVLHDAEDMVDPAELAIMDAALDSAQFVQLPVLALPHPRSPWISGHYTDEFAEAHGKTMVVRNALAGSVPGAGVGCALDREFLRALDGYHAGKGPFATGSLTEDYELGMTASALGLRSKFVRARTTDGRLIATRAFFPTTVRSAARQKARWIHGIALQGWDRLGWRGNLAELWMQLRDRRGPLVALLLATAYFLVALWGLELALSFAGLYTVPPLPSGLDLLLAANLLALVWRALARALFTTREHGVLQGILSIPRIIVSNAIAIVASRRALTSYIGSLRGAPFAWDKTDHADHPASKSAETL